MHMPITLPNDRLFLFLLLVVFTPLFLALLSQYVFGLAPCHLCNLQRIPYGIMLGVLLFGFYVLKRPILLILLLIGFISSTLLASYHVGVEQGYIALDAGCAGTSSAQTPEELLAELTGKITPSCDTPTVIMGLSMALWNALYSLGITLVIGYLLWRMRRSNHASSPSW